MQRSETKASYSRKKAKEKKHECIYFGSESKNKKKMNGKMNDVHLRLPNKASFSF